MLRGILFIILLPNSVFAASDSAPAPSVMDSIVSSMIDSKDVQLPAEFAQESGPVSGKPELLTSWDSWTSPQRLTSSVRVVAVMAALSLAPALLLMTTCYVRLVVVLSLLRQALGSQQLPPNQVTTALAMFLTALIMWPIWTKVHDDAIQPYTDPEISMSPEEAWEAGIAPIRGFMSAQIGGAGNIDDVKLFLNYLNISDAETLADVPLQALLPAFLISELKIAFMIGFQVFLPFVIIDLVVSSVTMSMGMVMVPPTTISLPLKLMLFVLVDGWHLVVEMLLMSFYVVS
jgi:flagellar biosynthetic protein FliP